MKIKIILEDSEVRAMVDKIHRHPYSKSKIADAGRKILAAYAEFEKTKPKPSEDQMTLDEVIAAVGGKDISNETL